MGTIIRFVFSFEPTAISLANLPKILFEASTTNQSLVMSFDDTLYVFTILTFLFLRAE